MSKISNVLILGAGSIGKRHIANIRRLRPNASIVVYDPVATLAPDPKVLLVRDDPFSFTVDCAVIASPTRYHYDQLLQFVHNYVPVYIEKPICEQGQPGESMTALADSYIANKSTCGFQYRFHPQFKHIETWRKNGEMRFIASDDLMERYPNDGVANVMASHPFDTACWVLGEPETVSGVIDGGKLWGRVKHTSGVSRYAICMDEGPRESWIESGRKVYDLKRSDKMYLDAMSAWLDCVEGKPRDPRLSTLKDGLRVTDIISQCRTL